ncbi:MAG: hypothetical protein AB7I98_03945 [Verrucomicrobiales bacterium]
MAPQFNTLYDYLVIPLGQYFARKVPAPGATTFNATGLPEGMAVDSDGSFHGIPTKVETGVAIITPSNGDGDGQPLRIAFEVRAPAPVAASGAPRVVMDLDSRQVFPKGGKPGDLVYFGRTGNAGEVEVFFQRSGVPEVYRPKQIKFEIKQTEPDAKRFSLVPQPSDVRYLGTDSASACAVRVSLAESGLRTRAAEFEDDFSTGFEATAQLVFVGPDAAPGSLSEPLEAAAGLELTIPGYVPLGDQDNEKITISGLVGAGWYEVRLEVEETGFGDGTIFALYYIEVAPSGSGLTVRSVEYNDEDSAATGAGTGGATGVSMALGIQGGYTNIKFEGSNLVIPVSLNIWAVPGTGDKSLTPTVTAIIGPAPFDVYDSAADEWASLPFKFRVERNLSPAT